MKRPAPRRSRWPLLILIMGFVAVGAGLTAWLVAPADTPAGTPRLAVDRTDVDLGRFPFNAEARAEFTLTNSGGGVLKVVDVPSVTAVKGC